MGPELWALVVAGGLASSFVGGALLVRAIYKARLGLRDEQVSHLRERLLHTQATLLEEVRRARAIQHGARDDVAQDRRLHDALADPDDDARLERVLRYFFADPEPELPAVAGEPDPETDPGPDPGMEV